MKIWRLPFSAGHLSREPVFWTDRRARHPRLRSRRNDPWTWPGHPWINSNHSTHEITTCYL